MDERVEKFSEVRSMNDEKKLEYLSQKIERIKNDVELIKNVHTESEKTPYMYELIPDVIQFKTITLSLDNKEQQEEQINKLFDVIDITRLKLYCTRDIEINLLTALSAEPEIAEQVIQRFGVSELAEQSNEETAIDLPEDLTIGVELEANGLSPEIAKAYFDLVHKIKPEIEDWNVERDGSINPGSEVTSPVLDSSSQSMSELYFVSSLMQKLGFETTDACGGHIHIGAKYLEIKDEQGNSDHGRVAIRNLMHIWQEVEEIIYKMSNGEGKTTRFDALGQKGYGYAGIEGEIIGNDILTKKGVELDEAVAEIKATRYRGMNFCNLQQDFDSTEKNTVEFRLSNGTINPEEIKQNIYLYGRLMVTAKEMVLEPEKYANQLEQFNRSDLTEAEKVEAFLSLIFEDEQQRDVYRRRWESVRDNPIYDRTAAKTPRFVRGDYSLREQPDLQDSKSTQKLGEEVIDEISDISLTDETEKAQEEQLRDLTNVQEQIGSDLEDGHEQ